MMIRLKTFENSTYPHDVDVENLANEMKQDAKKVWFNKLNDLFLNKFIKFRGSKWSEKNHNWKDFVIKVKKIDSDKSTIYGSEFTVIDANNEYYTILATMPIRVYNNIIEYEADISSIKYNL